MPVNAIGGVNNFLGTLPVTSFTQGSSDTEGSNDIVGSFASHLEDALEKVNQSQIDSKAMANDLAKGKTDNIDQVMIMSQESSIVMELTTVVRNKILEAYNELMRIPI